jgi:hypothetical protein
MFDIEFFAGIDGTGDLLIEHFEEIFNPESIIDKEVVFIFFFNEEATPFKVVDNIFDDKNKGLPFGSGKAEDSCIEFI